jgi:hypothetical protein
MEAAPTVVEVEAMEASGVGVGGSVGDLVFLFGFLRS